MQMLRVAKDQNMFLYAPAIQRMMERAYTGSVSPVLPPVSPFISPSQSGVSNLHLSFSGGASMSFGHISSILIVFNQKIGVDISCKLDLY